MSARGRVRRAAGDRRPPRLRADGLSRRFGTRAALDGVSFEVAPGELFGLLGPNGAGKTTAFRLLAGLLPPHAGTLALDGRPVSTADTAYRARLGVVFQEPSLDLKLTGRENLRLGAALYGVPRALATAPHRRGAGADGAGRCAPTSPRRSTRAACAGASRSRACCCTSRRCCCSTSPGRGVDPEALRRDLGRDRRAARRRAAPASS